MSYMGLGGKLRITISISCRKILLKKMRTSRKRTSDDSHTKDCWTNRRNGSGQ